MHPAQGKPRNKYVDRRFQGSKEQYDELNAHSKTIYIGNLSFNTSEDQLYALFSKVGLVKNVIMGRNKYTHELCGFCFVEFYERYNTLDAIKYLSATHLDNRIIRCDIDYGFEEGRQYGRGNSGGQVRDEYRSDFDRERGGYGKAAMSKNTFRA